MVNPRDLFILEKMGELELLRRNFLQSIEYCETALSLQSKSTDVVYHLACALAGAGRHKEAISAFLKVIDLIPSKIEAYFNCGNSFYAERNYKQAIPLYEKALSFQPIVEAYNNLGNAYMELGNIDLALLNYEKALHYQPHHKNAETQIFSINTQLSKVLPSVDFTQTKNPRIIIYSAISTFICGDVNSCKYFIDQYSEMAKDFPESVKSDRDVIFCNAYYHFLQKLCQLDKNESFSPDKCFHIGDSHCLSFANREITINGHKRQIIPKITVGGKAFHFSQYSNNIAKVITKYNLLSLPSRSTVLVSFGEIDCRPNEGFIPASAKKTLDLYELVTETVKGYLEWFVTESQVLNHDLIFFTVPAPVFNGDLAQDVNMKVAKVVDIFNTNLFDRCKLRGLKIIDTYRLTCGENGFSNGVHHIDKIHIGPTILSSYTRMSNSL
jgi:tetratricopeptide (TPR) repeat protein